MISKQSLFDWLFRIGLIRGTRINPPNGLVNVSLVYEGQRNIYRAEINEAHELAAWLIHDCAGPWTLRLENRRHKDVSIAFARATDAAVLKLMMP